MSRAQSAGRSFARGLRGIPGALWQRDGWRPTSWRSAIIQGALAVNGVQRGVVYVGSSRQDPAAYLGVIESVFPLEVWGWMFVGYGALALVGLVWASISGRVAAAVLCGLGHIGLSALYLTIGIGIVEASGWLEGGIGDPFNGPLPTALAFLLVGVFVHPVYVSGVATGTGAAEFDRRRNGESS